jgi:hypothetical protein
MAKSTLPGAPNKAPDFFKVTVTVFEDCLGTAPANKDIYSEFVASKALSQEKKLAKTAEERAAVQEKQEQLTREELAQLPEEAGKGVTVFRRDRGGLVLTDTMVRGQLKEGAAAMGAGGSSWGLTSKIDRFIFVTNEVKYPIRTIPLMRAGVQIATPDGTFERPLRAQTPMGQRVTLASSEIVKAPFTLNYYLYVIGLGTTDKGKITEEVLRSWLSAGRYTGYGAFRGGGHGRFEVVIEAVE